MHLTRNLFPKVVHGCLANHFIEADSIPRSMLSHTVTGTKPIRHQRTLRVLRNGGMSESTFSYFPDQFRSNVLRCIAARETFGEYTFRQWGLIRMSREINAVYQPSRWLWSLPQSPPFLTPWSMSTSRNDVCPSWSASQRMHFLSLLQANVMLDLLLARLAYCKAFEWFQKKIISFLRFLFFDTSSRKRLDRTVLYDLCEYEMLACIFVP